MRLRAQPGAPGVRRAEGRRGRPVDRLGVEPTLFPHICRALAELGGEFPTPPDDTADAEWLGPVTEEQLRRRAKVFERTMRRTARLGCLFTAPLVPVWLLFVCLKVAAFGRPRPAWRGLGVSPAGGESDRFFEAVRAKG